MVLKSFLEYLKRILFFSALLFLIPGPLSGQGQQKGAEDAKLKEDDSQVSPGSKCEKWSDAGGSGAVPYNFRSIDGRLFAGGSLFNPQSHANPPEKVREFLKFLKEQRVTSVISLHIPGGGSNEVETEKLLCQEEGLKFLKRRMTSDLLPNSLETEELLGLIDGGAYVHCMWGADRTGAVIAKYLRVRKGFSGEQAWKAVISGGSHSGQIGGLKQKPEYKKLILFFWPEVGQESREVCQTYDLPYSGPSGMR